MFALGHAVSICAQCLIHRLVLLCLEHMQLQVIRELASALDQRATRFLVAQLFAVNPAFPEQLSLADVKDLFRRIMFEQTVRASCLHCVRR